MPLQKLLQEGTELSLYYSNSNIYPPSEYELRLEALTDYAQEQAVAVEVGEYAPSLWETEVGRFGGPYPLVPKAGDYEEMLQKRKQRCSACYRLRFDCLAAAAVQSNRGVIASTLTISPYQFTEIINSQLEQSAAAQGIRALESDWRYLYPEATRASRNLGMYRQNYCGCRFSLEEAELEREARRQARKAQKALS